MAKRNFFLLTFANIGNFFLPIANILSKKIGKEMGNGGTKVAEVKWTKEQAMAISEKGHNILVAAAARKW